MRLHSRLDESYGHAAVDIDPSFQQLHDDVERAFGAFAELFGGGWFGFADPGGNAHRPRLPGLPHGPADSDPSSSSPPWTSSESGPNVPFGGFGGLFREFFEHLGASPHLGESE